MHQLLFDFISKYIPLNKEEEDAIIALNIFREAKKGTVLLKEGEVSKHGFFVLKGCMRTYYIIDGEEKTTAFYTEMEGITPNSVIDKKPSKFFISTTEDSIISISSPEMEAEIFSKFPKFETLCRLISEELLAKEQLNFDDFKTSSPEQRYAKLLESRQDLLQRVPQHQLASFLGVQPQSLSRLKARMHQKRQ